MAESKEFVARQSAEATLDGDEGGEQKVARMELKDTEIASAATLQVTPGRKREFLTFIKTLRSIPHDLSNFTAGAPPFVLAPISLVEYPAYLAERTDLFLGPLKLLPSAEQRAMAVLKWYVGAMAGQHGRVVFVRPDGSLVNGEGGGGGRGGGKKPLNPILGEQFHGWFDVVAGNAPDGRIEVLAEQVSHQPPISAYRISYTSTVDHSIGVRLEGYQRLRTHFRRGTICIERKGLMLMTLNLAAGEEERYLVDMPKMYLAGLLPSFAPYPELEGPCRIVGSNGFVGEVEFKGKGWFGGGSRNSVKGTLTKNGDKTCLGSIKGQWSAGELTVTDSEGQIIHTLPAGRSATLSADLKTKPIEEQDPIESRRVWREVVKAIGRADMSSVSKEKEKIEEEQRALRRQAEAGERSWAPRYFERVDNWPGTEELIGDMGAEMAREQIEDIWRWKSESAR